MQGVGNWELMIAKETNHAELPVMFNVQSMEFKLSQFLPDYHQKVSRSKLTFCLSNGIYFTSLLNFVAELSSIFQTCALSFILNFTHHTFSYKVKKNTVESRCKYNNASFVMKAFEYY